MTSVTLLLTAVLYSCGDDEPTLKPSDIILGPKKISTTDSCNWVTNGQTLHLIIEQLDYSTESSEITLSSIKVEKDGKTISNAPFKLNSPINVKVDGWSHGENTITLYAVFKSKDGEIEIDLRSFTFIVFNELPKYDIECSEQYENRKSSSHVFKVLTESKTTTNPLTGEFTTITIKHFPYYLSLFINEEITNFNAEITKTEIHWHTQDGPTELTDYNNLTYPVSLFANFTVAGVHEGIAVSDECTIVFKFI